MLFCRFHYASPDAAVCYCCRRFQLRDAAALIFRCAMPLRLPINYFLLIYAC